MSWTDAHCHIQENFTAELDGDVHAILERSAAAGVDRVVVVGTDTTTSYQALRVTQLSTPVEIYATVGLHPHEATSDLAPVAALARSGHPRLVGVGETGLDYYYEHSPRSVQREAFAAQIGLAHELDLALVIHARDAFEDLWAVLDSEGVPERTVIHCFTGDSAEAEGCLARGCDISVAGVVTFKNAGALREAIRAVPLERLHVETDSPFLAPEPHRGRANEPALVVTVGEFVAHLRDIDPEELAAATSANTARLFRL